MPNTIEWSKEEMQLLINLRKNRNEYYWRRFGRSKVPFWDEIATKIREVIGTDFTGVQAREKFKGMVKECQVSKILEKKKNKISYIYNIYIYIINFNFSYLKIMLMGNLVEDGLMWAKFLASNSKIVFGTDLVGIVILFSIVINRRESLIIVFV